MIILVFSKDGQIGFTEAGTGAAAMKMVRTYKAAGYSLVRHFICKR